MKTFLMREILVDHLVMMSILTGLILEDKLVIKTQTVLLHNLQNHIQCLQLHKKVTQQKRF